MPKPAFLDLTLYIPAGGVNGFELNGNAVNGVGFVDNPFFGISFELDPYRTILPSDRGDVGLDTIPPSLLNPDNRTSVQVLLETEVQVWAKRGEATVRPERDESSLGADPLSLALEVEETSVVPHEYRVAYVLADHPAKTISSRSDSSLDELPASQKQDEINVSYVPAEDRTSKVRRI